MKLSEIGAINDMPKGWKDINRENYKIYELWRAIIKRCYGSNPNYAPDMLCKDWLYLSKFNEDVKHLDNYNLWVNNDIPRKWAIDKDTIDANNRIYSKDTCKFVTISENTRDSNKRQYDKIRKLSNEEYVDYHKSKGNAIYLISIYDGTAIFFPSLSDCHKITKINKGKLSECLHGSRYSTRGYIVVKHDESYANIESKLSKTKNPYTMGIYGITKKRESKPRGKGIIAICKDGYIWTFNSIDGCRKTLHIRVSTIYAILRGEMRSWRGYTFKLK